MLFMFTLNRKLLALSWCMRHDKVDRVTEPSQRNARAGKYDKLARLDVVKGLRYSDVAPVFYYS